MVNVMGQGKQTHTTHSLSTYCWPGQAQVMLCPHNSPAALEVALQMSVQERGSDLPNVPQLVGGSVRM